MISDISEDSVDIYDGLDVGGCSSDGNVTFFINLLQITLQIFCFASCQTISHLDAKLGSFY